LYHYIFTKRVEVRKFIPIICISIIYILLRATVLNPALSYISSPSTLLQRIPGFFVAISNYIRLLFLPLDLHMEYGDKLFNYTNPKAILGAGILIALLIYAFRKRKTNRLTTFSIYWFFIALVPVSNLYPINAYMSEHWLYLPSIGFFLLLSHGLIGIYKLKNFKAFTAVLVIGLLAFYSTLTIRQSGYWKNLEFFYERAVKYSPDSEILCINLGIRYTMSGRYKEAIDLFNRAIDIRPDFAPAYCNLGVAYGLIGKNKEAVKALEKAIELDPDFAPSYEKLSVLYYNMGLKDKAIALLKESIKINPFYVNSYEKLANIYYYHKQFDQAIKYCDKAIEYGFQVAPELLEALEPYRRR
jgi:tetratricopeptide (TPR) repeat protein